MSTSRSGSPRREGAAQAGTVHVVDDDAELREYLCWTLRGAGWRVVGHTDAAAFLAALREEGPTCVVSDLYMPGLTGLELQAELAARGAPPPMIMMSAKGEVTTAVQAMRGGAVDFLEKPFAPEQLIERVAACLAADATRSAEAAERRQVRALFERLTPRQRAVLDGVVAGKTSKEIAADLGLSPRTVDVHRFRIMAQLQAGSLPELFRRVVLLRDEAPAPPRGARSSP